MPISDSYRARLFSNLEAIAAHFPTPFHIYDEAGIRATGAALKAAFGTVPAFQEFFAVKALPNPAILRLMHEMGFGFDCSSIPELILSRQAGAAPSQLMFTSNNTSTDEFEAAFSAGGCILNLDDIGLLDNLPRVPDLISFRYNPGRRREGNVIIGNPVEAKFGVAHHQFLEAYRRAQRMGVQRFGLHTMIISNERSIDYLIETVRMLLELADWLDRETGIQVEFINMGGGLGIPYRPSDAPLDLSALGQACVTVLNDYRQTHGLTPTLYMESGRYMTGPHGVLVTRVINRKDTYRTYLGVDATMSALMRPGMYGAYHHIEVPGKADGPVETVDVVGALCENNDKFAIQRELPRSEVGDLLVIEDAGAHGHAMGFNYNGRLRPKELLLGADGRVSLIRREETLADYFATLNFTPKSIQL